MSRVQLAVSPLGGVPGATAYHTSVLVDSEEFSFSDGGISRAEGPASHRGQGRPKMIDMGRSARSRNELMAALGDHFQPGTYDLLRKNCNSFSDAACYVLARRRLGAEYRTLERLGASMPGLAQAVSGGTYTPNPRADGFDLEQLIRGLDPERHWKTPGNATGGRVATGEDALRAARLLRFSGNSVPTATEGPGDQRPPTSTQPPFAPPPRPDSAFGRPVTVAATAAPPSQPQADLQADMLLARRLQAEEENQSAPAESPQSRENANTLEDERLAARLQAQEDALARGSPASTPAPRGGPSAQPQEPRDEDVARALQAEEEASMRRGSAPGGRQRAPGSRRGPPSDPLMNTMQEFGMLAGRMDQSFRLFGQELQRTVNDANIQVNTNDPRVNELAAMANHMIQNLRIPGGPGMAPHGHRSAPRGASAQTVNSATTTMTYSGSAGDGGQGDGGHDGDQCMVCLQNFQNGDQLRVLPCLHRYHTECIDPWLRRNASCPSCNHRFAGAQQ